MPSWISTWDIVGLGKIFTSALSVLALQPEQVLSVERFQTRFVAASFRTYPELRPPILVTTGGSSLRQAVQASWLPMLSFFHLNEL